MSTLIMVGIGIAAGLDAVSLYRRTGSGEITRRIWARIMLSMGALLLAAVTARWVPPRQENLMIITGSCFMMLGLLHLIELPRASRDPRSGGHDD